MTRFRYSLASFLQAFGIHRKLKRMTDAAYELHLMQEGEEFLGALCWPGTEEIEEISMEYWNIRRIERERAALETKIAEANLLLQEAHTERASIADKSKGIGQDLFDQREQLFELLENLNIERDGMMSDAQQVKRRFEALKTKAAVLKEEGDEKGVEIAGTKRNLLELREQFNTYKEGLTSLDEKIDIEQTKLTKLQEDIDLRLKDSKEEASESFGQISAANRDITACKAELGLLVEEYARLCREIGRYLNLNSSIPQCQEACKEHRGLLEQIRLLRQSIQWNKLLAEKASG